MGVTPHTCIVFAQPVGLGVPAAPRPEWYRVTLVSQFTAHNPGWGPHSVLANPVHRASPWSLECLPASFMCLSCVPTVCPAGQAPPEGTWVLGPLSPPAGGGDIRSGCWRPVPALPAPALGSWCVWGLGRVLWDSEEVSVNPALSPWPVPCSRVCSPACLTSRRFPFSLGERNGGQGQLGATRGLGSQGCCHNTPDGHSLGRLGQACPRRPSSCWCCGCPCL